MCRQFARFADNLQAEIKVKLEELIGNYIYKSAADLLEEYRKKLSELAQDVNVGNISIDPFELMAGDISGLSNPLKKRSNSRKI